MNNIPIENVKRQKGDLLVAVYVSADIPPVKLQISKKEEKQQKSVYLGKINEFYQQLYKVSPKSKKEKLGYFTLLEQTFNSAAMKLAQLTIEKGSPDILVNISRYTCGTYDFYKAAELVEIGRISAMKSLDEFEKKAKKIS
jgi:NTE family protein